MICARADPAADACHQAPSIIAARDCFTLDPRERDPVLFRRNCRGQADGLGRGRLDYAVRRVLTLAFVFAFASRTAQAADTVHFAVGPLQPTPGETKKAFDPFFKHLAAQLGAAYTLEATTDWAGIAVALASGQVDVAWMGPWGYVIAHNQGAGDAVATAKYDGKPVYHAIVIARPDLQISKWPDDGKGLRISFADVGSTSGWLIPTFWFKSRGLDPKTYFQYHEGATHAANEIAVANGQTDLATDFDRNRTAMIESGAISPQATKIVWTSDDLPNDAIAARAGLDPAMGKKVQDILIAITDEQAAAILPKHYTGFIASSHASYKPIEDAGIAVGALKNQK